MKTNVKSEKGITIIVLVITVIVMIIIAGVSVRTATGESGKNGVIQRTTEQKKDQSLRVDNESRKINEIIESENVEDWGY